MVILDALGRRGALRILWELRGEDLRGEELRGEPLTFRALQVACDTNPGSLNTRIKELRALGIIGHSAGGYFLTDSGRGLMAALGGLRAWADDWAADIRQV